MAYVILASTTKQRSKATLYANGTGKLKAIDRTTSTQNETSAVRLIVTRYFGADIADTIRMIGGEEARNLTCGHADSPMRKQCFNIWTFKQ